MPKIDSISAIDSVVVHKTIVLDTVVQTVEKTTPESIELIQSQNTSGIPFLLSAGIVVSAIILVLLFKIIEKYFLPILESSKAIKDGKLFLFRIKCGVWFLFVNFVFYQLIVHNLIIGLGVTIFIILLGLNFWKDYFVGLYFKIEGKIHINDFLTIGDFNGKVVKFNKRHIEIATENESILYLPYRNLINTPISKKSNKGDIRSRKIIVTTNRELMNVEKIEALLLQCPWVYSHRPNTVTKIDNNSYEIRVFGTNNFTYNKIETFLNKNL